MADIIPAATRTTKRGKVLGTTPLQRKAMTNTGAFSEAPAVPLVTPEATASISAEARAQEASAVANQRTPATKFESFKAGFGGVTRDLWKAAVAKTGTDELDPKWDVGAVRDTFRKQYAPNLWDALEQTKNKSQYDALIANANEEQANQQVQADNPWSAFSGNFFDPAGFALGGGYLKGAQMVSRARNIGKYTALASAAIAEGATYGAVEAIKQERLYGQVIDDAAVATTFASSSALIFGLSAATMRKASFGAPQGTLQPLRTEPNTKPLTVMDDASEHILAGRQGLADAADAMETNIIKATLKGEPAPKPFTDDVPEDVGLVIPNKPKEEAVDTAIADAGSAANVGRQEVQKDLLIESASDEILDIQDLAKQNIDAKRQELGKNFDYANTKAGKFSAITSNFLQGMQSKSDVIKNFVLQTAEDSTGFYRAATSGSAVVKHKFNKVIRNNYSNVHTEFAGWAKRNGEVFTTGRLTGRAEQEFNRLLRSEMEARDMLNGLSEAEIKAADDLRWQSTEPEIRRAADYLDKGNADAVEIMIRSGVDGAEQLRGRRGYVPRRLNGELIADLARTNPTKFKQFKQAYAQRMFDSILSKQKELIAEGEKGIRLMTLDKATTIADGMVDRAIKRAAGLEQSTIALFDRAARDEIESILKSAGADETEVRYTFALLDKRLGTGTASNRLKGRIDIDINTPDVSGINFAEFYDNDLSRLFSSYSEEISGRAALARVGIKNDNAFSNILNAATNQGASAKDVQVARDIYSQMLGRPLKGQNENKFVHISTNVNPLQTLGQVGFAQGSESSLALSRLGIGTVLKSVPVLAKLLVGVRKDLLNESDTLLLKDLEALNGPIGEEWRLFKPSTDVMENLNSSGEISRVADRLLKAGQQINGYLSFMHQVMEAQLKTIAVGATRRFAKEVQAGVLTKRLADAGFSEESMKRIKAQFDKHAEYRNGELYNMNLSKWDADDAFDFTTNIERLSGQLIQRDFVGETASWMHGDMGRLFLSLRGYSVKAFNKQLVRNVRIADAVTAQAFIFGTAFSTAAYIAKAHVVSAGREDRDEFLEDRLTGAALAQGVAGYVGLGAFGTELLRPLASWAGEAGEAGAVRSGGNAVVAALPGLAPLDRALTFVGNVGSTAGSALRGSDANDWTAARTRQAVGTFGGNSLFVAIPLNYAVDDDE